MSNKEIGCTGKAGHTQHDLHMIGHDVFKMVEHEMFCGSGHKSVIV